MLEIKVVDVLRKRSKEVTQISKMNDKPWFALIEEMKEIGDKEVVFDFYGIDLLEPWSNMVFRELMQNEKVYLRVYSSDKVRESIDNWCMLAELKTGRVENVRQIIIPDDDEADKKLNGRIEMFKNVTTIDNGVAYVDVDKRFSNLGDAIGPKALVELARKLKESDGITKMIVDTGTVTIENHIVGVLAEGKFKAREFGVDFTVISDYAEKNAKLNTHEALLEHKDITVEERVQMFEKLIPSNTIGMLSKYADGKGKDEFGRHGNGKVIKCVPAIYKGVKEKDGHTFLEFTTYKVETFCTALDYSDSHDGDEHPGLEFEQRSIIPEDIGLGSLFVGGVYHFNLPVQFTANESKVIMVETDGGYEYKECTLPEYIKEVVKDFNLEINMEELENDIQISKVHLESVLEV